MNLPFILSFIDSVIFFCCHSLFDIHPYKRLILFLPFFVIIFYLRCCYSQVLIINFLLKAYVSTFIIFIRIYSFEICKDKKKVYCKYGKRNLNKIYANLHQQYCIRIILKKNLIWNTSYFKDFTYESIEVNIKKIFLNFKIYFHIFTIIHNIDT